MNGTTHYRCSVTKEDFLESFVELYHVVKDYDELVSAVGESQDVDAATLKMLVQERVNNLKFDGVNLKAMEMIGAYIRFSLEHYQGEKLHFNLPAEPEDDFFSINDGYLELQGNIEKLEQELSEIEEKVFYLTKLLPPKNIDKLKLLLRAVACLFKSIIRKDHMDMESHINHIHHLTASKESYFLINEIGHTVREIYNSLQDFSSHVPTDALDPALMDEMPDAIDKLNLVIKRMEEAANKTLDDVEDLLEQNSKAQEENFTLMDQCTEMIAYFKEVREKSPEMASHCDGMIQKMESEMLASLQHRSEQLKNNEQVYFEIIGAQSFQDITGQTLKKIINFIEELEMKLLNILQKYSGKLADQIRGASAGMINEPKEEAISPLVGRQDVDGLILHGPNDSKSSSVGPTQSQADIDKMLANFGF